MLFGQNFSVPQLQGLGGMQAFSPQNLGQFGGLMGLPGAGGSRLFSPTPAYPAGPHLHQNTPAFPASPQQNWPWFGQSPQLPQWFQQNQGGPSFWDALMSLFGQGQQQQPQALLFQNMQQPFDLFSQNFTQAGY